MASSTLCHAHAKRHDTLLVEECPEYTRYWESTSDVVLVQRCLPNEVLLRSSQAQVIGSLPWMEIEWEDGR